MRPENSGFLLPEPPVSLKDVLLLLCPCRGGSRGRGEGVVTPLWEVFELVWSQLDDDVEGILGERHFISQILGNEVRRWKTLWQSTDRVLPNNLLLAIGDCDEDAFPNIHRLLSFPPSFAPHRSQAQKLSDRFHLKRIKTCSRSEDTCWKSILWSCSDRHAIVEVDDEI